MAVKNEDRWLVVGGLGAVAFGYWYWSKNKADNSSAGAATADDSGAQDDTGTMYYYPSMRLDGNGTTTGNQVSGGGASGTNTPIGSPESTQVLDQATADNELNSLIANGQVISSTAQHMSLPVNG